MGPSQLGLGDLYRHLARARAFEIAVEELWERGLISGEMHLGTGEEAVAAGVVSLLRDGDGLSLTHRCSPALVVRGVPMVAMVREMLGKDDGLCGGNAGHMHLMSKPHLATSSGIVGASLPVGAGFALAAKRLRPGAVGVSFVGDGAMNQGMVLEAMNLASAWSLPHLIVCIDNGWAITTRAGTVTAGTLEDRARAFDLRVERGDGTDLTAVHRLATSVLDGVRAGKGPAFLYFTCPRLDGHFLGDPLIRQARNPLGAEGKRTLGSVVAAVASGGGGDVLSRASSVARMVGTMAKARRGGSRGGTDDPLLRAQRAMKDQGLDHASVDVEVEQEVRRAVELAMADAAPEGGTVEHSSPTERSPS